MLRRTSLLRSLFSINTTRQAVKTPFGGVYVPIQYLSSGGRRRPGQSKSKGAIKPVAAPPPPSPLLPHEAWQEVKDPSSGQIYWWNTVTNETTPLGAPKPTGATGALAPAQEGGSVAGGLGRVVAEGFAFGVGSSIARNMVGSFFGGSSDSAPESGGDADSGDGWDL